MSWQRIKTITKTIQLIIYQWSVQCFHQWDEKRRKYQVFEHLHGSLSHTHTYICTRDKAAQLAAHNREKTHFSKYRKRLKIAESRCSHAYLRY